MAQPITITLIRDPAMMPGDRVQLRIGGTIQPDRITPWASDRERDGYGQGMFGNGGFGVVRSAGFGGGPFGFGGFGVGVETFAHRTVNRFVAADYTADARSIDAVGNTSDWSAGVTIEHRPAPPPPRNLTISDNTLNWEWSDP